MEGQTATLFWNSRRVLNQTWHGRSDLEPYSEATGQFWAKVGMEGQTWDPILKPQKSFKPKMAWKVRLGIIFWNHRAVLSQSWYGRSDWKPILKQQKRFKPNLTWKVRLGTLFWNHRKVLSQSWYGRSDLEPYSETTEQI